MAVFGGLFIAAAFVAEGAQNLGPVVVIGEVVLLLAAIVVSLALVRHQGRPLYGMATLLAAGVFTVFAGLSVAWSLVPDASWIESNS